MNFLRVLEVRIPRSRKVSAGVWMVVFSRCLPTVFLLHLFVP